MDAGEELYDFFRPFSEQALFNGTYKKVRSSLA